MAIMASSDVGTSEKLIHRLSSTDRVGSILISNRSATTTTIEIWFVPPQESTADKYLVFPGITLKGNRTTIIQQGDIKLGTYDSIFAKAAADTVTLQVHST